jgi:energy-coupling factor transporter ATP-binding protein EcfA2
MSNDSTWKIFHGTRFPHDGIARLPEPPSWRPYRGKVNGERAWPVNEQEDEKLPAITRKRGTAFHVTEHIVDMVNAALYLRRPLLVTGHPGSGKSSLVDAIAYELRMGPPLRWSVTSRSTLRDALYQYDAIGRLQQNAGETGDIGSFITLGPLGTALLPTKRPRALLIDEIDKSDIDLPNDLLNVFEEGEFEIPELRRLNQDTDVEVFTSDPCQPKAKVNRGRIAAYEFPLMILTSNGEREFPTAFLRRCLRLQMPNPTGTHPEDDNKDWKRLDAIIKLHFKNEDEQNQAQSVLDEFKRSAAPGKEVATDQLLNAIYFVLSSRIGTDPKRDELINMLTRELTSTNR